MNNKIKVAWMTDDSRNKKYKLFKITRFNQLNPFTKMRAGNIAQYLNKNSKTIENKIFNSEEFFDIVVFQKVMDAEAQKIAKKLQENGTLIVFDANVNYYEIFGEFAIDGTRPTEQQKNDAIAMTSLADLVVADSSYIATQTIKYNKNTVVIEDNVDLALYKNVREHNNDKAVRLIWCGMAKKAKHLLLIKNVLSKLDNAELIIVAEQKPELFEELNSAINCSFVKFSDKNYAKQLAKSDVIISPKILNNSYSLGHTEYKITLGMAAGLPVVASPQQSYIDALKHKKCGFIVDGDEQWLDSLNSLVADYSLRKKMGADAYKTVKENYTTEVISKRYEKALIDLYESNK